VTTGKAETVVARDSSRVATAGSSASAGVRAVLSDGQVVVVRALCPNDQDLVLRLPDGSLTTLVGSAGRTRP